MNDSHWMRVGTLDDVPIREGRVVRIGGHEIAVFNLGGRLLAVDNRCPHKGGPLADGIVVGDAVVCPLHAWRVNLESGQVERPAASANCVPRYDVRLEDGHIWLLLPLALTVRDGEAA
jgi:nitrite reductase (NADH) small subunit